MSTRLIQFKDSDGKRAIAATIDGASFRCVTGFETTRELALTAHRVGQKIEQFLGSLPVGDPVDYDAIITERRILVPLDHPDPAHCVLAITGLTHLGSAAFRDELHQTLQEENLSDSMKMFKLGLEGGKPATGQTGVQPEWAYKGDGDWLAHPEQPLHSPAFAEDGGEEGEICGLYVIADDGTVLRVGYALANEFSDHVMEERNYLYLAHSKLRMSSFGPELLVGDLPPDVEAEARILRDGKVVWAGAIRSGEAQMCHSIDNLERHHFKYAQFRRPGDVHVYYYGASTISYAERFKAGDGDVFEIDCPLFGRPLRNPLICEDASDAALTISQL